MKALGNARLVQTTNTAGNLVKAWDLRPFGGTLLQLGSTTAPLPPPGTVVDRTLPNGIVLRIDVATGGVFEVRAGDPRVLSPTIGKTGGIPMRSASSIGGLLSPTMLALAVGLFFAWQKWGKGRR